MKYFLAAILLLTAAPALAQTDTPPPAQAIAAPAAPAAAETTSPAMPATPPVTIPSLPDQAVATQRTTPALENPNSTGEIMLTKDSDVNDADKVGMVVDQLRNSVRACLRTGQGNADECQCKFPNNLDNLKTAYDSALRLHPDWDGKMVSFKKGTAPTESVSFGGLKNQLAVCEEREKAK